KDVDGRDKPGHDDSCGLVDHAHVGGDHVPAVGKAHPGLHLPPDLAGRAVEQGRGDAEVAAVGGNHRAREGAGEAERRARRAEAGDFGVAVENLVDAVADGTRIVAEYLVESRDVVRHQGAFVALEGRGDFGDNVGQVDVHENHPAVERANGE